MRVQLLNVEFSFFFFTCPDDGFSLFVDLAHEGFCFCFWISEDFCDDECDVVHEVDRVIEYNDVPRCGGLGG